MQLCPPPSLFLFSQGYHLQTTRDMRPHPSVTLDPATYNPPQFRSRNQSYMRAVSTLSQASCVSQVSPKRIHCAEPTPIDVEAEEEGEKEQVVMVAVRGGGVRETTEEMSARRSGRSISF